MADFIDDSGGSDLSQTVEIIAQKVEEDANSMVDTIKSALESKSFNISLDVEESLRDLETRLNNLSGKVTLDVANKEELINLVNRAVNTVVKKPLSVDIIPNIKKEDLEVTLDINPDSINKIKALEVESIDVKGGIVAGTTIVHGRFDKGQLQTALSKAAGEFTEADVNNLQVLRIPIGVATDDIYLDKDLSTYVGQYNKKLLTRNNKSHIIKVPVDLATLSGDVQEATKLVAAVNDATDSITKYSKALEAVKQEKFKSIIEAGQEFADAQSEPIKLDVTFTTTRKLIEESMDKIESELKAFTNDKGRPVMRVKLEVEEGFDLGESMKKWFGAANILRNVPNQQFQPILINRNLPMGNVQQTTITTTTSTTTTTPTETKKSSDTTSESKKRGGNTGPRRPQPIPLHSEKPSLFKYESQDAFKVLEILGINEPTKEYFSAVVNLLRLYRVSEEDVKKYKEEQSSKGKRVYGDTQTRQYLTRGLVLRNTGKLFQAGQIDEINNIVKDLKIKSDAETQQKVIEWEQERAKTAQQPAQETPKPVSQPVQVAPQPVQVVSQPVPQPVQVVQQIPPNVGVPKVEEVKAQVTQVPVVGVATVDDSNGIHEFSDYAKQMYSGKENDAISEEWQGKIYELIKEKENDIPISRGGYESIFPKLDGLPFNSLKEKESIYKKIYSNIFKNRNTELILSRAENYVEANAEKNPFRVNNPITQKITKIVGVLEKKEAEGENVDYPAAVTQSDYLEDYRSKIPIKPTDVPNDNELRFIKNSIASILEISKSSGEETLQKLAEFLAGQAIEYYNSTKLGNGKIIPQAKSKYVDGLRGVDTSNLNTGMMLTEHAEQLMNGKFATVGSQMPAMTQEEVNRRDNEKYQREAPVSIPINKPSLNYPPHVEDSEFKGVLNQNEYREWKWRLDNKADDPNGNADKYLGWAKEVNEKVRKATRTETVFENLTADMFSITEDEARNMYLGTYGEINNGIINLGKSKKKKEDAIAKILSSLKNDTSFISGESRQFAYDAVKAFAKNNSGKTFEEFDKSLKELYDRLVEAETQKLDKSIFNIPISAATTKGKVATDKEKAGALEKLKGLQYPSRDIQDYIINKFTTNSEMLKNFDPDAYVNTVSNVLNRLNNGGYATGVGREVTYVDWSQITPTERWIFNPQRNWSDTVVSNPLSDSKAYTTANWFPSTPYVEEADALQTYRGIPGLTDMSGRYGGNLIRAQDVIKEIENVQMPEAYRKEIMEQFMGLLAILKTNKYKPKFGKGRAFHEFLEVLKVKEQKYLSNELLPLSVETMGSVKASEKKKNPVTYTKQEQTEENKDKPFAGVVGGYTLTGQEVQTLAAGQLASAGIPLVIDVSQLSGVPQGGITGTILDYTPKFDEIIQLITKLSNRKYTFVLKNGTIEGIEKVKEEAIDTTIPAARPTPADIDNALATMPSTSTVTQLLKAEDLKHPKELDDLSAKVLEQIKTDDFDSEEKRNLATRAMRNVINSTAFADFNVKMEQISGLKDFIDANKDKDVDEFKKLLYGDNKTNTPGKIHEIRSIGAKTFEKSSKYNLFDLRKEDFYDDSFDGDIGNARIRLMDLNAKGLFPSSDLYIRTLNKLSEYSSDEKFNPEAFVYDGVLPILNKLNGLNGPAEGIPYTVEIEDVTEEQPVTVSQPATKVTSSTTPIISNDDTLQDQINRLKARLSELSEDVAVQVSRLIEGSESALKGGQSRRALDLYNDAMRLVSHNVQKTTRTGNMAAIDFDAVDVLTNMVSPENTHAPKIAALNRMLNNNSDRTDEGKKIVSQLMSELNKAINEEITTSPEVIQQALSDMGKDEYLDNANVQALKSLLEQNIDEGFNATNRKRVSGAITKFREFEEGDNQRIIDEVWESGTPKEIPIPKPANRFNLTDKEIENFRSEIRMLDLIKAKFGELSNEYKKAYDLFTKLPYSMGGVGNKGTIDKRLFYQYYDKIIPDEKEQAKQKTVGDYFRKYIPNLGGRLVHNIFNGALGILNKIKGEFVKIIKKTFDLSIKPFTKSIKLFASAIKKAGGQSKVLSSISELLITPLVLAVEYTLLPVLTKLIPHIKEVIDWVVKSKDEFTLLGKGIANIVTTVYKTITGNFILGFEQFFQKLKDSKTSIETAYDGITTFFTDLKDQGVTLSTLSENIPKVQQTVANINAAFSDFGKDADGKLKFIGDFAEEFSLALKKNVSTIMEGVKEYLDKKENMDYLKKTMTNLISGFLETFSITTSIAGKILETLTQSLADVLSGKDSKINLQQISRNIATIIEKIFGIVGTALSYPEVRGAILSVIGSMWEFILGAFLLKEGGDISSGLVKAWLESKITIPHATINAASVTVTGATAGPDGTIIAGGTGEQKPQTKGEKVKSGLKTAAKTAVAVAGPIALGNLATEVTTGYNLIDYTKKNFEQDIWNEGNFFKFAFDNAWGWLEGPITDLENAIKEIPAVADLRDALGYKEYEGDQTRVEFNPTTNVNVTVDKDGNVISETESFWADPWGNMMKRLNIFGT